MEIKNALNPLPIGLSTDNQGRRLLITRRWCSHSVWLTFIFCLFWNAFIFNCYSIALPKPSPDHATLSLPLIHVGVGLYLIDRSPTRFFNRTRIMIGDGKMIINHEAHSSPVKHALDFIKAAGLSQQNRQQIIGLSRDHTHRRRSFTDANMLKKLRLQNFGDLPVL
jgi:hypothetical protein